MTFSHGFSLLLHNAADKEEDSQVATLLPELSKRKSQKTPVHFYQNPFKVQGGAYELSPPEQQEPGILRQNV